jgi:hypothetical protein
MWSQTDGGTGAWSIRARWLLAAVMLAGCSDLDPNIGPPRTEPEDGVVDGGDPEAGDPDSGVEPPPPGGVSFKEQIRPLMDRPSSKTDPKGCKSCHYRTEASHTGSDLSGLDLSTLGALRKGGGSSGIRIVVPGKPAESVLIQVLKGQYAYSAQMPKNGPFWTAQEIETVAKWISEGAKGADDE